MTFSKTITPTADPETASQYSADDPCGLDDIPDFLQRTPGKARRAPRPGKSWKTTPAMKAVAGRDAEKRAKIAARPVVCAAVEAGAETFGQIRKATGLDGPTIRSALRFYVNRQRYITKTGKRYSVAAQRRRPRTEGS